MSDTVLSQSLTLELVREYKIHELLPEGSADDRFEASGVCARDGCFYVIFDNAPHIARLDSSLTVGHPANVLLRQRGESAGFEDLTYHARAHRFLVIIESLICADGVYRPNIEEYTDDFRYLENKWVDFALEGANKGLEGLAYVYRDGQDVVLGLCEGNRCKGGKKGRKPGGGRIQILNKGADRWDHRGTLKLPKTVRFRDYASLDLDGNRIAVVSQISSALWIGELKEKDWDFVDDGALYRFPRDEEGKIVYGNIEGVSWISSRRIVVVSDKRKPGEQAKRCAQKDQSIHIFDIPGGAE
jgi:hypothetical protein